MSKIHYALDEVKNNHIFKGWNLPFWDYHGLNVRSLWHLYDLCGFSTKNLKDKMLWEGDITHTQYNTCLRGAQVFYKESLESVLTKTDMSE